MKQSTVLAIARAFVDFHGHKIVSQKDYNFNESAFNAFREFDVNSLFGRLVEWGSSNQTIFLQNEVSLAQLEEMMHKKGYPFLLFARAQNDSRMVPVFFAPSKNAYSATIFSDDETRELQVRRLSELGMEMVSIDLPESTGIPVITALPVDQISEQDPASAGKSFEPYRLLKRFFSLLATEKREILYIVLYAIMIGLISLTLPLGVQSLVGFISSGQIMTSVVVLIVFILIGVFISGIMTIMQLHLLEHIHQRLFSKTAFSFAFRVPRIRIESIMKYYPPELMNRFFDTLTLMKGMSVVLIDFFSAVLQTIFGMLLLSLYHPLFLVVGLLMVLILGIVIRLTGPKGLKTALNESAFKYMTANWLEEIARSLGTFKLAGKTNFALDKTDHYVSNYIQAREDHFKVLKTQYYSFVVFKTIITALLLILGAVLITQRQINLGQFVAAEIIIILVINSIEKIILKLDTVYDVLVSVQKITDVTDLPIEIYSGIDLPVAPGQGISVGLKNISYRYSDRRESVLRDVNLEIAAGERICIAGFNGSGKTTLAHLIIGLYDNYTGAIVYNGLSLRDLNKASLMDHLGDYVSQEGVFDGTLLENIVIGRPSCTMENVLWAINCAGLSDFIQELPEGMNTRLIGGSVRISESIARKIIIARNIVERPGLLVLDDFLLGVERREKKRILDLILSSEFKWTVILISNDPMIMRASQRLVFMNEGIIEDHGTFDDLQKRCSGLNELINETVTA